MRLFILLFFTIELMAASIDPLLLKAQASIFPKIMLLDSDIATKTADNKLVLSIIHTSNEKSNAQKLKEMMDLEYVSNLGNLNFEVRLTHIDTFNKKQDVAAYYIFDASTAQKKKVVSHAKASQRICFGYNYKDFDKNILISLFVKEKTYIYLNKSALHEYQLKFTPIFYRIAKIIE